MATNPVTEQELIDGATDLETIEAIANSSELTTTTRLGNTVKTMAGIRAATKYDVPVTYTSGLNVTTETYTVDEGGVIYAVKPSSLPIASTPGSFDSDDWYPIQYEQEYLNRDTVAEMIDTSATPKASLTDGQLIRIKGYNTTSDGGQGAFEWDASSTATENGGTIIEHDDGGTGRFIRVYEGVLSAKMFGAKGDNSTNDTTALQAAIDYINSTFTANGASANGGGGGVLYVPAGRYKFSTLTLKPGVSIRGDGRYKTTFLCTNNGGTGFKNASASSQVAADIVSFCEYKDFTVRHDHGTTFDSGTILWDMTGFTRCEFYDVDMYLTDYCTGMSMIDATLAGSGGPQNWYNNFFGCRWLIYAGGSGTGVGMELGDSSSGKEQITSWHFYGCSWRATGGVGGTGLKINSGTGCTFNGINLEGLTTGAIVGTTSGTRGTQDIIFNGVYGESCTTGFDIKAQSNDTMIMNMFATAFTIADNGSQTRLFNKHEYAFPLQSGGQFEIKAENAGTRPTVSGEYPGWLLSDDTATKDILVRNGSQVNTTGNAFHVYNDTDSTYLVRAGSANTTLGGSRLYLNNSTSVCIIFGSGTPEGSVAAGVGSTFHRTDGGTSTSLYVKESGGVGNTGWVAK